MSDRCATRTTSCASADWSMGSVALISRARSSSRVSTASGPLSAAAATAAMSDRRAPALRAAGRRARLAALAAAHLVERVDGAGDHRRRRPRPTPAPASASAARSRIASAWGRRSRSPASAAPAPGRPSRAASSADGQRPGRSPRSTRPTGTGPPRGCSDTCNSTRPRARPRCSERPHPRLEVGQQRRQPQLQVEEPVIDRAQRDRQRAARRRRAVTAANPVMLLIIGRPPPFPAWLSRPGGAGTIAPPTRRGSANCAR